MKSPRARYSIRDPPDLQNNSNYRLLLGVDCAFYTPVGNVSRSRTLGGLEAKFMVVGHTWGNLKLDAFLPGNLVEISARGS